MEKIISDLWFEKRDIISDGFDNALRYISKIIPISVVEIPTGTECWTWTVPLKWSMNEGWIRSGNKIYLDASTHPLHVLSYSQPVKKRVSKDELLSHLHTDPKRPDVIPFEFSYYEKKWGFCIEHYKLSEFTDDVYDVFIDSRFDSGFLKIGELVIPGEIKEEIVLVAHLCHPCMANDNLSGIAVLVEVAKELIKEKSINYYSYRILFLPETIGSIAYLSQNEHLIPNVKYAISIDSVGHNDILSLQHSRQATTEIDNCASYVFKKNKRPFREGAFNEICLSDERVFNGPGVNIPTICISRFKFWGRGEWPYPEYHSNNDTSEIIINDHLNETKEVILDILGILNTNYTPIRKFKGPIFLSKYQLWVDWRKNRKLNSSINEIMFCLEGDKSILEIARDLDLSYSDLYNWVEKLYKLDLIKKKVGYEE